jgi:hypothetical protein
MGRAALAADRHGRPSPTPSRPVVGPPEPAAGSRPPSTNTGSSIAELVKVHREVMQAALERGKRAEWTPLERIRQEHERRMAELRERRRDGQSGGG